MPVVPSGKTHSKSVMVPLPDAMSLTAMPVSGSSPVFVTVYTISADPGASPRLTAFASRSAALPLKSSLVMLIAGVDVTVAK